MAGLAAARCDALGWHMMLATAGIALALLLMFIRSRSQSRLFVFACIYLAGLGWGWLGLLHDARGMLADDSWLHSPLKISGQVEDVVHQGRSLRLTLNGVRRADGTTLGGRVRLYVYAGRAAEGEGLPFLLAGDRVRARATLHRPRNHRNPSGFDYVAWCFDHHIALTGSAGSLQRTAAGASWLERVRQRIRHALAGLPEARGGIIQALLLAERQWIPEHIRSIFAATGTAHLLAISGLHVGLVAGLGFALCWFVLTRREAWIVRLPVRNISLLAGVLLALLYASLAGWPLPTRRATLMLAAAAAAWWWRARGAPLNTLLAALMLILLFDPAALDSLSLWLSFAATAGILLWAGRPQAEAGHVWLRFFSGLFAVTLIAWLVTLPVVAHAFGRLAPYSLPANLLATPLYTLFVLPVSLFAALLAALGLGGGAHAVFALAGLGVGLGNSLLAWISDWPGGQLWLPAIPLWLDAAYAAGLLLAARLLYARRRAAAAAVLLATLTGYAAIAVPEHPPSGVRLVAWDVGQGAAASLTLPGGKVMVVDAAGRPGSRFNAGTTMAEGLRGMGLTHVDVLLITHAQLDHFGGAASLLSRLNGIGELWLADVPAVRTSTGIAALRRGVEREGGRVRWLHRGGHVQLGGADGTVLWPPRGYDPANANNASLVLRLTLPSGQHLLLDGDIESPTEAALVSRDGGRLASDVMLMPHHGSRTSSTPAFLAAVHPAFAIAQTGYANRYGFPAPRVLARYRALGSGIGNTADGAVILDLSSPGRPRSVPTPHIASHKRNRALQWWHHFL